MRWSTGDVVAGRYQLGRPLGEGGYGAVFEATRLGDGLRVALKVMHARHGDSVEEQRFHREAATLVRIQHPNVVQTLDYGQTPEGVPFIALELLEGRTLRDELRRAGPLHPARAVAIVRQVLAALGAAHALGVVHRDIKPGNIFLRPDDTVSVLDFGLAKSVARPVGEMSLTTTGQLVGTPHYMSPEQVRGEKSDPSSDLYALGLVFGELLTNRKTVGGTTDLDVYVQHFNADPIPLPPEVQGTPLAPILARALAKRREDRYPSAAHMLADLDALGSSPAAPAPASFGPQAPAPASLGPQALGPASFGPQAPAPASLGPQAPAPASLGSQSLGPQSLAVPSSATVVMEAVSGGWTPPVSPIASPRGYGGRVPSPASPTVSPDPSLHDALAATVAMPGLQEGTTTVPAPPRTTLPHEPSAVAATPAPWGHVAHDAQAAYPIQAATHGSAHGTAQGTADGATPAAPTTGLRAPSKAPWLVAGALVVAIAGVAAWQHLGSEAPSTARTAASTTPQGATPNAPSQSAEVAKLAPLEVAKLDRAGLEERCKALGVTILGSKTVEVAETKIQQVNFTLGGTFGYVSLYDYATLELVKMQLDALGNDSQARYHPEGKRILVVSLMAGDVATFDRTFLGR